MTNELEILKKTLYTDKRSFHMALGDDEKVVNKYLLGVYNTVVNNTDLLQCTPQSIKDAAITSATLGVPIDARQYAYLVPYGKKAQFQLSYKGYVNVAKRDLDVDNIQSVIVYQDDEFSVDIGANTINHIPSLDSASYGDNQSIKFVYAIVRFRQNTGRAPIFEVMTKKQIDGIRDGAKQDYIWKGHYGEMARKTVIKRLCKHAQLGDIARFDEIDNANENNKIINVTPDGELLVDDMDSEIKNKIIDAVEACNSKEELTAIQAKYQDNVQEFVLYNVAASKDVGKAMGKKDDELYINAITESLENCEDEDGLDKVYNAHDKRINQLKAKDRNSVTEVYVGMKQHFIDRGVDV